MRVLYNTYTVSRHEFFEWGPAPDDKKCCGEIQNADDLFYSYKEKIKPLIPLWVEILLLKIRSDLNERRL